MKKFIILLLLLNLSSGCETARDSFSLKKKDNSDEFLVEKKNPLVMPPDFDDLPKPGDFEIAKESKDDDEFQGLFKKNDITTNEIVQEQYNLKDLIIKKID